MRRVCDRVGRPTVAWFAGALTFLLLTGCSGGQQQIRQDLSLVEQRIQELERSYGRWQVQMVELEEKVLLLEDRVEAHRISLERRGLVARRSLEELPAYQPPEAAPDYSYVASLPVQRLTPDPSGDPIGQSGEPTAELVITNETLDDYARLHSGNLTLMPASNAPERNPIPPVVTGERLPVNPTQAGLADRSTGQPPRTAGQVSQSVSTDASTGSAASSTARPLDLYQQSLNLFNTGEYEPALRGFTAFFDSRPEEDYLDNALYWIGECHYAAGRYPDALVSFQRVVDEFPDGNKVPDSLLKIGLTYERLNSRREATMVLSVLVETYPLTDAARRASLHLTELN
ncbi:MAG: tol-pal system protein YbgF [Bradymonadales bacterium]|nr:tol-pal system protein YbgF [Bradymonadales bacterium]